MNAPRSYERIGKADLRRLAQLAATDREQFYRGRPEYRERLFCVALCQGAAQHYVDVKRGEPEPTGVKDFDVYSFFSDIAGQTFPAPRRNQHADFGPSRFDRESEPPPRWRHYTGRRVDFLMRGLPVALDDDPVQALREYLGAGRTKTSRLLALKAAVLIEPAALLGTIVWPLPRRREAKGMSTVDPGE